jgi:NADPH:quinone reductase-like Zn-dependent oxidoreductase
MAMMFAFRGVDRADAACMKAAAIDKFGPPSVLKLHELPMPEPDDNQVLIQIHTAGVGGWDASMRKGEWKKPGRPKFPRILGLDGSGVVVAKGKNVRRLAIGDRVWAYDYDTQSFYAEYVAIDADNAARVPRRMSLRDAGAAACTGLTAYQGVADQADVRRGQTVFVFGATGAVGSLALQFAKARDARVIATATGRKATELVKTLGAKRAIDARSDDAPDALEQAAPDGIATVLAFAGGRSLERLMDLVSRGGMIVYPNGVEPEPAKRPGVRLKSYDAVMGVREFARLTKATEKARLVVPIDGAYPLARAADAHRRLDGHVLGRIVLSIRRGDG